MSSTNKSPEEAAINEIAGGDQKSKRVLHSVAKRFKDSDAVLGLVKTLEEVGLRGRAIGQFHAIACDGDDQLFVTVIINESTGVTKFGIIMYSSPARLRALAEMLKNDETTQKMRVIFG